MKKKSLIALTTLILMNLCACATTPEKTVKTESIPPSVIFDDIILDKGEKSPGHGVWVSPDNYREYIKAVEIKQQGESSDSSSISPWTTGFEGFLLGALAGLLLRAK